MFVGVWLWDEFGDVEGIIRGRFVVLEWLISEFLVK